MTMLAAVRFMFGRENYNSLPTMKALTYFDDPALADLPDAFRRGLTKAVHAVDLARFDEFVERYRKRPEVWKTLP
jgi:hypothetical protein